MAEASLPMTAFFPNWATFTDSEKQVLETRSQQHRYKKGTHLLPMYDACLGMLMVQKGQFRVYTMSERGKEVTLYRLLPGDSCLFSASCVLANLDIDLSIEVESDAEALVLPSSDLERVLETSLAMSTHVNQLMAARFSDVLWSLEQIVFRSMDSRLATVLLAYADREHCLTLELTHERLARDLGSAREVVTRLLQYFRSDRLLELARGRIILLNEQRLRELADASI